MHISSPVFLAGEVCECTVGGEMFIRWSKDKKVEKLLQSSINYLKYITFFHIDCRTTMRIQ